MNKVLQWEITKLWAVTYAVICPFVVPYALHKKVWRSIKKYQFSYIFIWLMSRDSSWATICWGWKYEQVVKTIKVEDIWITDHGKTNNIEENKQIVHQRKISRQKSNRTESEVINMLRSILNSMSVEEKGKGVVQHCCFSLHQGTRYWRYWMSSHKHQWAWMWMSLLC